MSLAKITLVALSFGVWSSATFAQSQYNGPATSTDTVRSRLPADGAVKADPAPKPSMVGHPAAEFHPPVKTSLRRHHLRQSYPCQPRNRTKRSCSARIAQALSHNGFQAAPARKSSMNGIHYAQSSTIRARGLLLSMFFAAAMSANTIKAANVETNLIQICGDASAPSHRRFAVCTQQICGMYSTDKIRPARP